MLRKQARERGAWPWRWSRRRFLLLLLLLLLRYFSSAILEDFSGSSAGLFPEIFFEENWNNICLQMIEKHQVHTFSPCSLLRLLLLLLRSLEFWCAIQDECSRTGKKECDLGFRERSLNVLQSRDSCLVCLSWACWEKLSGEST